MTKNRTRTPVYLDPGMHPGLEVKGLKGVFATSQMADTPFNIQRDTISPFSDTQS